ncbi:hypothetical protein TRVA0_056S00650 [Trichomonascus vanleenenianus]|uniref:uncharacterized protein n=1 Tax=Trichomonascus vanleenenianus TaxID=2268995 RepID=UPI003ECB579F
MPFGRWLGLNRESSRLAPTFTAQTKANEGLLSSQFPWPATPSVNATRPTGTLTASTALYLNSLLQIPILTLDAIRQAQDDLMTVSIGQFNYQMANNMPWASRLTQFNIPFFGRSTPAAAATPDDPPPPTKE